MKIILTLLDKLNSFGIKLGLDEDNNLKVRGDKSLLDQTLVNEIRSLKPELIEYLLQCQRSPTNNVIGVFDRNSSSNVVSYGQLRLWLLDQIDSGSAHYNIPGALRLTGELNVNNLNQTFTTILERHESLRTCFAVGEDGQPLQIIQAATPFVVPMVDLSNLEESARQLQLGHIISDEANTGFDLSRDLMLRAQLIKVAADEHIVLVTMHHVASDGWSMSILINEFSALYSAYVQGQENPLTPLSIQYADYAHWQRNWLQGDVLDQQLGYWEKQLASLPVVHSLPLDHPRPQVQTFVGANYGSHIDTATSKTLNNLCQAQGATLFMGLHAAFSVLLSRYSNEADIVVGSPIANREQAEIAGLIGFFVNTLVLRSDLSESPSFTSLLNRSKVMLLDAYAHQQVPFEQIVERLQPERNLSHSALFQVMLVLQNNEQGTLELPGLTLSAVEQSGIVAKYDLTLNVAENEDGLWLSWEYNTDLFEQSTIARMANHFGLLLKALVTTPNENVFNVEMLDAKERQQLLVDWNNTQTDYPNDKCIHELFEAQVKANPDAIAVTFENQTLSYQQLNEKANQLAHYLISEKQVAPDTLVGICVERSLEMVVGILAILKSGGAYVPLDPEYPEARLKYMLDDAQLTTVLTQSHLRETTPVSDSQAVCLDSAEIQQQLQTQSTTNPDLKSLGESGLTSNNLAYVIYTSGSTGNPKGVMVEHNNVANFLTGMGHKPGIKTEDCLLAVTSTSFDIHGLELFLPLVVGAKLVVASREATGNPELLFGLIKQQHVSIMQATPATWKMLLDAGWQVESPLKVLCGGEALGLHLATELLNQPQLELWNMYGPTETTIWSTTQQILPQPEQILMGQPIANTQIYLAATRTEKLELAPVGVAGELLIGGAGVTRGYLHRPDLTAEKFIANPFYDKTNPASSERLYKTGDLVRWLPNGHLEFLGRIDHQVKIRGFRIELGEIENALISHPQLKDSVVVAKEARAGDKQLVAYVVPKSTEERSIEGKKDISFSLFYFGADTDVQDNKYELYLKAAKFADEEGFEAIWTPERHFDPVGGLYPNPAILSAAIATMTQRVHLRSGSVVLPLHDPIRVAEEWSVVDNLSNGRVGVAIASGWHTRDFVLAPENFVSRKEAVTRGIETLKTLWSGNSIVRKDGNGNDIDIKVFPNPVQRHLPIWVTAAGNPETFIEAGRLGAHLLTHLLGQTIEELEEKLVLYRESLARHGYDPRQYRVTLMIHTYLGEDLEQTIEEARVPFTTYMRAHISLLLPVLKGLGVSIENVSEADLARAAEFAFERYTRTASLIGTPQSTLPIVERIKDIGVDEVACLIDWMDSRSAMQGFEPLRQLQRMPQNSAPSKRALAEYCSALLPHYMVPSAFMVLDNLPLTPNGKVDRKALPEPDFATQQNAYVAPTTETEKTLCGIWQDVLGVERVGISDNFFRLGGHSLSATLLVSRINAAFNTDLPLKTLFTTQTLEGLAKVLLTLGKNSTRPMLAAISRDQVLLPSYAQQRLWLLDQIESSVHYNMPSALRLMGTLNRAAVDRAFTTILERHESLRTCFAVGEDGQPIQIIQATTAFVVPVTDLSAFSEGERQNKLAGIVSEEASGAFDLATGLMLRAQLVKLAEDEHIVLVTVHHIASDGWSISILVNEFSALYSAYVQGFDNPLPPLAIQYADYAHWQRNWLQGEAFDQQLGYWEKQLAGLPVAHSLPLDHARPAIQSFIGATYSSHIDATTIKVLGNLCQTQSATLFMGLHAAFSVLLSRYSNEADIVVGTPIANREQAEIADLIGFFVNTLVLRSDLSESPSFKTLISQSKAMLLDAYAHQQVPFEQIVERLQPERSLSHSALFQVMLVLHNNEQGVLELPGLTLSPVEQSGVGVAKYDLTLTTMESPQGLNLYWEYNTDLFEANTIVRMANHFGLLLNALLKAPGENVFNVDMLDAQERQQLLVDWNNTQVDYPNDKCIHELFEAQVETNPNAIAITFENQTLSYQQLNEKANQLAHYLIKEKQVTPDTLVGICVERSLDMVVGILAILKSGGAYVPLDPEYPEARLKYMLDDAQLTTVLTQSHLRETTPVSDAQAVCLDSADIQQQLQTHSTTNPDLQSLGESGLTSNNLAYVIYTSGSTGNPKGVMVEHNNVANFLTGMGHKPGIKPEDCLLAVTSTSFDIHGLELFLPLVVGAKLVVASREATGNPELLFGLIKQQHVSIMQATPATWKMLLDAGWQIESSLKVLCGGEALGLHLATELLNQPQLELWNMYGPTETTIWSTTQQILPQPEQILMGQPIANTQIYLAATRTEKLELAPVGVAGELLIGGAGVTRGYLHRPDLTAEKFIANPFYDKTNPASSERLYKTGDLVRWLPNGHLEFLGRIDHQVKIRGFRIELGEIENALISHPQLKDSVVVAKEARAGDKQLVAYVVPKSTEERSIEGKKDISFSLFYFGADTDVQDNKYELYLKAAKFADEEGFEAIWTPERHFDPVGGLYPNPAILSAAIATMTQRVHLRSGSVVLPLHDPIRVAEEWSVVDNLSNGRVGVAIASGWHTRDFVLAPENFVSRKEAVTRGIETLKTLWSGNSIVRKDGNGNDIDIKVFPNPVQRHLPIWVTAAGNPETFIEAGRLGAHLLTHLLGQTIEELEEKLVLYRESLARHGYDPKQYRVTLMIHTYLGEDLEQTIEEARVPFTTYMRAHISLLLPVLKGLGVSIENVSEADLARAAEFAFERYTRTASLIGTPQSTLPIVERIKDIGVDEVACLIDWMDSRSAMQGFEPLRQLQRMPQNSAPSKRALAEYCSALLPHYMVPSAFMVLDNLPLTPNGKVDRKALPEPDFATQQNAYVAPTTETEKTLCGIWQDVLGVERVGISDNFFRLGGHSLSATLLVSRINAAFNTDLPLKTLFTTQTLEGLAKVLLTLGKNSTRPMLAAISRDQVLLPSYAQQRLWLLDQIEGSTHYNMPSALRLTGTLNRVAVDRAFTTIMDRHESLRTFFTLDAEGQTIQVIQTAVPFVVPVIDLSGLEEGARQVELTQHISDEASGEFDLSRDLMLRARLIKLAEDEHIVLVTVHHIASDGWSISILVNEFSALYSAYVQGFDNPLPPLAIQYADYAHWQRNWLQGEAFDQQLGYWEKQLARLPVAHSVPLDYPRPAIQSFIGATYHSHIDTATIKALGNLCQLQGATLFMGLHAAFSVLLSRYSNETDIVVGTPIANREQAEIANLIGFFVNTLVLRSDLSESPSFKTLISQSKAMLLDAYAHQQVPFEQIVERLQPERNLSHSALFQVMLVLHNNEQGILELPALTLSPVEYSGAGVAKYDLTLITMESPQGLNLYWEYNTDLFEANTIARMANHFDLLLNALLKASGENVFNVDMLDAQERQQLLVDWNNTQVDYPNDKCIHELFEAQVETNPNAVAVTFESKQLTYAELNNQANQLAHYLINEKHITPDTLVGICVERSLEMVVGILAILKSGGAYVPLDPEYPEARLKYMLDDAQLTTVLTQSHLRETTPVSDAQAVCLDDEKIQQQLQTQSTTNPDLKSLGESGLTSNSLAYVIYTSGSTGNPKGVMVEHHALVNRIDWMDREYGSSPSDRILQKTPFSFDVSVWEFVWPLSVGASIVLAKPEGHKDPVYLSGLIRDQQITKLHFVPSMLGSMLALGDLSQCTSLQQVFCSGEALALHHVKEFQAMCPWAGLHNLYGPTEAAIDVSYWDCAQLDAGLPSVPIGRPISNIQLHVLNPQLTPVPQGVAGELHIGGVGLARGYLNRADLTAEKFVPNPFYDKTNPASSERLYKTGDLVRWLPDGNLEYLGRIDHQVKIRGFRIELGEIENTLSSHAAVTDAVVLAKESGSTGDKRLVAYVVTGQQDNPELVENLRHHLHQTLPDYMVPGAFVLLDSLPLTPNGKVDRKALPESDISTQQNIYIAPTTETEKILCEIWQEVLGVERVGITDNFFQLGGHSLLIMQVISKLQQQGIAMAARQLFASPQLKDLAKVVEVGGEAGQPIFKAPANLIPDGCEHISPDMLPLVNLTTEEIALIVESIPGGVSNVQDIYPLGPLQEGILFQHMMSTQGDAYVLPSLFKMDSHKAVTDFIGALQFIVNRHDTLRTAIVWKGLSIPVQVVCRHAELPVTWLELDASETLDAQMRARCEPSKQWMDLGQAPLLQLQVAADADSQQHFVLLQYHHIISDHVGLEIIQKELALYQAGQGDSLPVPIPYREFVAHAQHQALHNDATTFFTKALGDVEEPTAPFDVHDVNGDGSRIVELRAIIPASVSGDIRRIAKDLKVSPAALFHTAWAMVVAACSGRDDIVFGTVLSGRLQGTVGAEHMLGVFINTLPLRVELHGLSVAGAVSHVQDSLLNLLPYEQSSLTLAQRCSGLPAGSPLFTAMLNYRHSAVIDTTSNSPTTTVGFEFLAGQERTNYPLTLSVDDFGDAFGLDVQVDQSIDAERVLGYVQMAIARLAKALNSAPEQPIMALSILPEAERQQLLVDWNNTQVDYPNDKCIHELFEAQVETNPDAIAVTFENQTLSYQQLNEKANQLAHYLINEKQIKPDTLVGICVERSLEMVVGILAILKAGGAYVPLDPEYPEARLKYMLDDAQLTTVLTQSHLRETTPVSDAQAVCLDSTEIQQQLQTQSTTNPDPKSLGESGLTSNNLAYVIYTSGSTGNPKGVLVEHYNITRLLDSAREDFEFNEQDVWTLFHSYAFDFSVWEIWGALAQGGRLVVVPYWVSRSPSDFYQLLSAEGVTVLNQTPSAFSMLVQEDAVQGTVQNTALSLRYVVFGGEALNLASLLPWFTRHGDNQPQLINMYGITETTVHVTYRRITQDLATNASGASLIGKPLSDLQLVVLNDQQRLVPVGVAGEMYVGGAGVTRGYLNQPALTQSRFVSLSEMGGKVFYRTGDLARYLPNGELEYLGRIDHQVKIRGFRIELGEIESALTSHELVKDAIVLAKASATGTGDKRLVAYVVTGAADLQNDTDVTISARHELIEQLRQHLGQTLPDYMVPSAFVLLESLPLTTNGKVDRKALPEPDFAAQQNTYVAPTTETEKILCNIWQEVLGVERVGITDNFFQLGGHSLLIMQVIARLQQQGLVMTARELFTAPSLGDLAIALDAGGNHGQSVFKAPANLIAEGCTSITPEMLPLVELSTEDIALIVDKVPGGVANVQDIYPLGPLQEGILFQHMMATQGDPYVLPSLFKLNSRQAVTDFIDALQFITNRHDTLRTAIIWQGLSVPVQVVCRHANVPVSWPELDPSEPVEAQMRARCVPGQQWMDLGQAPLLQLQIAEGLNAEEHYILLQYHHIISDHVGLEIIQKELALYQAGQGDSLPAPIPYREFIAHTQHQALHNDATAFFTQTLGDVEEPTAPFDVRDVNGDGSRIVEVKADLPHAVSSDLRRLAKGLQVSPAALFHTAWAMVVGACSGRDDVVFGTVMSGRLQGTVGAEHMLGVFINTLPLRVKLHNASVIGAVRNVQDSLLDLLPYEQSSLALAQRCSALPAGSPLFTAMFNYRHSSADETSDGVDDQGIEFLTGQERTNYPFTLAVDDFGDAFALDVQVHNSLDADRIMGYVQTAVAALVEALQHKPEQSITALPILPEAERQQLLVDWNNTQADYPNDKCIHELFEAQAKTNPNAVAVTFENQMLSYQQLNEKSNQLAHYLISEKHIKPDTLVGICVERSLEMVVGILAILKAGGAYVPLDPEYPEARLKYMLDDAQLTTVLTQSHLRETTPVSDAQAVCLDDEKVQQQLHTQSTTNPNSQQLGLTSNHLAYVIYTSGSTGNPKGAMAPHRSIYNRVVWMEQQFPSLKTDVFCQKTTIGFVDHVAEIFQALAYGKHLVIVRTSDTLDADNFIRIVAQHQISRLTLVPSLLKLLIEQGTLSAMTSLRLVISSGEALQLGEARNFNHALPNAQLLNLYGSSEIGADVTAYLIGSLDENALTQIPIGKPIAYTQLIVVDANSNLVPSGISGELHVGGAGVARGYLNRPELTAEKFIVNPFYDKVNPASSEYLYKTGDLVRWLPDGNLEYLGRIDHQVKIRGFRIELGEIENRLSSHVDVKDAIVVVKESPTTGDKRLVAYVVTDVIDLQGQDDRDITKPHQLTESLYHYLNQILPDYMVPSAFVLLEQLPLNPNGKVDRKALPEPDISAQQNNYVAPRTEAEKILCEIWSEMFSIPVTEIGANSNFFRIGGDSLSSIKFKAIANKRGVYFNLKEVIQHQTVEKIAEVSNWGGNAPPITALTLHNKNEVALLPEQKWFFSEDFANPELWNVKSIIPLDFELDYELALKTLSHLASIHDALLCKFVKREGEMIAVLSETIDRDSFNRFDLSLLHETAQDVEIQKICRKEQNRFDCENGPLFSLAYFYLGEHRNPLLFYTFHHLIFDANSVDVFIDDFRDIYFSLLNENDEWFPKKAYSLSSIVEAVENIVADTSNNDRLEYWMRQPFTGYRNYKTDFYCEKATNVSSSVKSCTGSLGKAETEMLLDVAVKRLGFALIDVIYYAASRALRLVNDGDYIPIWHVASGRSFIELNSDVEMDGAIGWFSMPSPRFIKVSEDKNIVENLKSVVNSFKEIPDGGCSYLPLFYSNDKRAKKIALFPDQDKVVFNHLGFRNGDTSLKNLPNIEILENQKSYRACLFSCTTEIENNELKITWNYSENQYKSETIHKLVNRFLIELRKISTLSPQKTEQLS